MIGCLRSLGPAARYVSGYLLTEPRPASPRLVGADASHAWVSVWSPSADGGDSAQDETTWFDLDPTNDRPAGEDYVTPAIGRDFFDASPLRGVIHGGDHHVRRQGVTVEPVSEATGCAAAAAHDHVRPPRRRRHQKVPADPRPQVVHPLQELGE